MATGGLRSYGRSSTGLDDVLAALQDLSFQSPVWNRPSTGWIVYVRNLTWEQNDYSYPRKRFGFITGSHRYTLPLWFHPGNRYRLTVKGYKREGHGKPRVVCEKSVEFRTGAALSKPAVTQLLHIAESYVMCASHRFRVGVCTYLYRNKPRNYFDEVNSLHGGVMETYLKDASGDPQSPINGELHGLFFFANVNQHGQPFSSSPFGDTRLLIRVEEVLKLTPNMYFADFHCMGNKQNSHHVTIVLTKTGSSADEFCKSHLPRLLLNANQFLFENDNGDIMVSKAVHVDVFVTEELNVKSMIKQRVANMEYNMETHGMGKTSQGGQKGVKPTVARIATFLRTWL